jgi:hypothetical protein
MHLFWVLAMVNAGGPDNDQRSDEEIQRRNSARAQHPAVAN